MTARFYVCDVFDGLAALEDGSVDLVVTSPPLDSDALPVRLLPDATVERLHLDGQLFETPSDALQGSTLICGEGVVL